MIPTLFGIMLINFIIIQTAPGGPVEQAIAQITGQGSAISERITRSGTGETLGKVASGEATKSPYRGAQGLDPQFIKELEKRFGFDKPLHERFLQMMRNYLLFDFGKSFFRDRSVVDLVLDKMPVSISLGVWTTLLVYLVSIPLGIGKAVRDGSRFDVWTSFALVIGTAIPSFLFAVFLLVIFAGGSYLNWFPLRGLVSEQYLGLGFIGCLTTPACVVDYFWHITLPVFAMVIGGFATLTMLTKNYFLEQLHQQYVLTARAKGLPSDQVHYKHALRNALLPFVTMFGLILPALIGGSVIIESIFSWPGMGRMAYEAILARDYPVILTVNFVSAVLVLAGTFISDLLYLIVDPRIRL